MSKQTRNGKGFEFAIFYRLCKKLKSLEILCSAKHNKAYTTAKRNYNKLPINLRLTFDCDAEILVDMFINKEFGKIPKSVDIYLQTDRSGVNGDVRDIVIFSKCYECGISAKSNNNFTKSPRISNNTDIIDKIKHLDDYLLIVQNQIF